jgi:hypothetical protein
MTWSASQKCQTTLCAQIVLIRFAREKAIKQVKNIFKKELKKPCETGFSTLMSRRTELKEKIESEVQKLDQDFGSDAKDRSKTEVKEALEGYLKTAISAKWAMP